MRHFSTHVVRRGVLPALATIAAIGLLSGCSSAPGAATAAAKTDKKFVIGFEQPLGGQAWRETGLAALQALAHSPAYKDKVTLKIVRTNDNDAAQQNAAMQNLIASGVDAILFDPASSSGANAAITQATAQKIPVIANGGPYDSKDVYVVSTDWGNAGTIGAKWLLANLGTNKKVAVLEGLAGVPLNDGTMPGVLKILKDGGAEIVAQGTNGWNEATAQQNMATILRSNPDVGGVYSFLTGGQGVPEAFKAAGLKFVPTVGGSGYNGEACELSNNAAAGLKGDMVFGQPAIYAKGLEQAVKLLEGKKIAKTQLFPPLEITAANAKTYCLPDQAANFQLGYDFPGLDIKVADVVTYYQGK
ncbi:substrate-binding domain-containing protein [Lacisediminihabitans profunda]|uniref:Substrate-binding domain-containing protein n=1 Tax=Lacisediminihabitans profunda TaxID=2594790 RepID=A0A5C8UMP6_9MICO|nr:substrate-binding domain-containing protein [Lacisediminihabitans profunda]TXN28750.1 substrate-binding domain-containing protein [Lacisediminihabitans profunda]